MSTFCDTATQAQHVHVSQSIGNSLCSQPALLMSSFGILAGKYGKEDRGYVTRRFRVKRRWRSLWWHW